MYLSIRRRDKVSMIRNLMKSRRVRKVPGISNIEVGSEVHSFVVGDLSHPHSEDIVADLQRLAREMRHAGYVPNTKEIFHDVGEEQKEELLQKDGCGFWIDLVAEELAGVWGLPLGYQVCIQGGGIYNRERC
ncbi:hypothetical protein SELMODRAFT_425353 [Selaginella moellendorffii]|uniref:Uncharacterized protein n=1 Tax=Selaginella moellendorffii TaxID=88036 RepID=D8SSU1_SELML|nr:putative pentatricopeptide repeat-containing protein At3g49142 [Selaginella moellendorffii]EFJ12636.1 hypothetical protein SELMODRAFT_425353 [Selaginella moellendorffii]|eukprot:XP_002986427.1 putative pentatricopeptide repeat-containing protein At3g49142 [Selaginella moellendorffii]